MSAYDLGHVGLTRSVLRFVQPWTPVDSMLAGGPGLTACVEQCASRVNLDLSCGVTTPEYTAGVFKVGHHWDAVSLPFFPTSLTGLFLSLLSRFVFYLWFYVLSFLLPS